MVLDVALHGAEGDGDLLLPAVPHPVHRRDEVRALRPQVLEVQVRHAVDPRVRAQAPGRRREQVR
ncbi:hypothetical protein [Arthrobacter sp. B0490]|uniref:hypothetical protein n=1 Tax=Arthrobacter sp. B0490 TaxID=2058891 RepID=UPI000CE2E428|nr:hypothetical protein [Arthrobacter sp. B0490]